MTWQFTLSGFLIGCLVGVTGMGGGSLLTPILVIFFGFKPTLAVGTDILHGAIFKSFGAVRHRRLGTVHARLTFWMFLGSGPMSLLGVAVATWLKHNYGSAESIEAYAVGVALVIGGMGLVAKTFIKRGIQPDDAPFLLTRRDRLIAFTLGATCGFVVGTVVMADIEAEISSKVLRPTSDAGTRSGGSGSGVGAGSTNGWLYVPIRSNVRKNSSDAGPLSSATTVPMPVSPNPVAGS